MDVERLIIVGSGPAGLTAASCAARLGLAPVVIEGAFCERNRTRATLPLGQLNWSYHVNDYPGFPGAPGPEICQGLHDRAAAAGARFVTDDVVRASLGARPFGLETEEGVTLAAHSVIVAPGLRDAEHRPFVERLQCRGVTSVLDDAPLARFRDRSFVVESIEDGRDDPLDATRYMCRFASRVFLVHDGDRLRGWPKDVEGLLRDPRVTVFYGSTIAHAIGNEVDGLTGVTIRQGATGGQMTIDATGLFRARRWVPNTEFLAGQLRLDPDGSIWLREGGRTLTSVAGVFAAGDAADRDDRRAVTAAASGCRAAMDAWRWLVERGEA